MLRPIFRTVQLALHTQLEGFIRAPVGMLAALRPMAAAPAGGRHTRQGRPGLTTQRLLGSTFLVVFVS